MKKISIKKIIFFYIIILNHSNYRNFLKNNKYRISYISKTWSNRGFSLLPNSEGVWSREKGAVKINSDGLRDYEHTLEKPSNTIRIAILGDSYAEARSVNIKDTFWFKLNKNLESCKSFRKGKKIEILNFGVSEYGTTQQYLTLKNYVWKYDRIWYS